MQPRESPHSFEAGSDTSADRDLTLQVWGRARDVEAFHAAPGQGGVERSAVLRVPIVVDALAGEAVYLHMPAEGIRLGRAPFLRRVQGRWRHKDASLADVDERQHEELADAAQR